VELHPRVRQGLEAQLERRRAALRRGARPVGWKLGLGIPEVEELMGAEPVVGYLTSETLLPSGAPYSAAGAAELRAETELAVKIGHNPGADPDPDEASAAIAGIGVALELVDVGRPEPDVVGVLAGNVFHRALVLGPVHAPRTFAGLEATLTVGDERRGGAPRDPAGAPPRCGGARLLETLDERLEAGDRIITGSVNHVPVVPGDMATVAIDTLGRLSVKIVE
jgi:2-keto-4-pentenoate hydratase